jgi:hypothetical protein
MLKQTEGISAGASASGEGAEGANADGTKPEETRTLKEGVRGTKQTAINYM